MDKNYIKYIGNAVYNPNKCDACKGIREEELNNMFISLFNTIAENNEYSEDYIFKKIENAIYKNNGIKETKKLEDELEKYKKKMLYLLDLKLEDQENEELYKDKENEIKEKIKILKEKIDENKKIIIDKENTQKRIDNIKNIVKETKKINEFNDDVFKKIIDKIIIGEVNEDGTKNYGVVRFVLKTGEIAKFKNIIDDKKNASFEFDEWIH